MITTNKHTSSSWHPLFVALLSLLILSACNRPPKTYRVGISQCSEDIWRYKQNKELEIGSYIFDDVKLEFKSADDDDERQIQQIQEFVDQKVDLLIVAPNSPSEDQPPSISSDSLTDTRSPARMNPARPNGWTTARTTMLPLPSPMPPKDATWPSHG